MGILNWNFVCIGQFWPDVGQTMVVLFHQHRFSSITNVF